MSNFKSYLLPTLSVSDAKAAITFYEQAFGAIKFMGNEAPDGTTVAVMAIGDARFIVADESPEHKNFSPQKLSGVSVRIGLMVADPDAMAATATAAGITTIYPVADQHYGYRLGHFVDPFGHHWEIGRPLS